MQLSAQQLIDAMPDGLIVIGEDDRVELVNHAAARMLGTSPDAMRGLPHPELFMAQDVFALVGLRAALERGTVQGVNAVLIGAHDRLLPVAISAACIPGGDRNRILLAVRPFGRMQAELARSTREMVTEREKTGEARRLAETLEAANEQLVSTQSDQIKMSRAAGMAEVAAGVLHNVGNVLNGINVAVHLGVESVQSWRVLGLRKVADEWHTYLRTSETERDHTRASKLADYLTALGDHFVAQQGELARTLSELVTKIDHLKAVVAAQQRYATATSCAEPCHLGELFEEAITLAGLQARASAAGIVIVREIDDLPTIQIDKHKVMEILINLLLNACDAIAGAGSEHGTIRLRAGRLDEDQLFAEVEDTGQGILKEDLVAIFSHGFTTKAEGHGFGLHRSALLATELRGDLQVASEGQGHGATFRLCLPSLTAPPTATRLAATAIR